MNSDQKIALAIEALGILSETSKAAANDLTRARLAIEKQLLGKDKPTIEISVEDLVKILALISLATDNDINIALALDDIIRAIAPSEASNQPLTLDTTQEGKSA